MTYPTIPDFRQLADQLTAYAQLKAEYGAKGISGPLRQAARAMQQALREVKSLPDAPAQTRREPDDLDAIRTLRPAGPRRLWQRFDTHRYPDRLEGALLGRLAGCTLGAPVEFYPIERMMTLARENNQPFPPTDYWHAVPDPYGKRYRISPRGCYTRDGMDGVPVDDDIVYTLLGLLIAERYGTDFTTEQVGQAWLEYLPYACTAEEVALENLKKGIPASRAGKMANPYSQWIGADIRADPWGYLAPGWPEQAAEMAYRDAYLSHRREGIYGEIFFAAAIAAAFDLNDPVEAIHIGLTEIPRHCRLSKAVRWALEIAPTISNYHDARNAVDARFDGMHPAHTINNACLTIWGITIGGTDFTRVIGETVAMGLDNDCTAATAGSIVGAIIGRNGIPPHWHRRFNNTIHTYLNHHKRFAITAVLNRFKKIARTQYNAPKPTPQ